MLFQEFGNRSGKPNILFYIPLCLLSVFYQELYYSDSGEEESGALCDQV